MDVKIEGAAPISTQVKYQNELFKGLCTFLIHDTTAKWTKKDIAMKFGLNSTYN